MSSRSWFRRCSRATSSSWTTCRPTRPPAFATRSRRQARRLLFLPPYSPDFNPIENAFAKLKALLRAKAERTIDALWDAVGALLDLFTPAECANYFKAAGYDPD